MRLVKLISNDLMGLDTYFPSDAETRYECVPVGPRFDPDFGSADAVIVPNGSDHVAMAHARPRVREYLDGGGTLMCFDGWFTDWVPGNQWRMDNSRATRDVRYHVVTDRHALMSGVELDQLQFSHGMSGWWACGYIEAAPGADVLLADTWGRAVMVLDEVTTVGRMILTASGPLAPVSFSDDPDRDALRRLYLNLLALPSRAMETAS